MSTGTHRRAPGTAETTSPAVRPTVPRPPPTAVERPRLLSLLDLATQLPLTVVVAPPGYGKTVLLAQWARLQRRTAVGWLQLGPEHDDPLVLLDSLMGLLAAGASAGPPEIRRHAPRRVHTSFRSRFVRTLTSRVEQLPATTLVLDDFHHLTNPVAVDLLAEFLDHAPRTLRVVLATRADPPLRYFHLHDHEVLFQLRQEDMAFTEGEASQLLDRLTHVALSPSQVAALVGRTEGWAAGLQLAALALPRRTDLGDFVTNFAGDDRAVADYLTERVLDGLPRSLRDFLLMSCQLDRMSAPLCDHAAGREDSAAMLDELERRSLFVTALDGERSWFRYHGLFRSYLRSHAQVADGGERRRTLRRAADWHRCRGDTAIAAAYLMAAGCWDGVLDLTSSSGAAMVQRGGATEVAAWLGSVPPSARPDHVGVALLEAAALASGGQLRGAHEVLGQLDVRQDATPHQRAVMHLLQAWRALREGALEEAVREAGRAERAVAAGGAGDATPPVLGLVRDPAEVLAATTIVRGAALVHLGRYAEARVALRTDADGLHARWSLLSLGSRALLEAWSDRLGQAEHLAHRTLSAAEELDMAWDPATVHASVALSVVARCRGRLALARSVLETASSDDLTEEERLAASDLVAEHALLSLAEGETAECLTVLADRSPFGPGGRAAAVSGRRPALEAEVFLAIGDLERASRSLRAAPAGTPDVIGAKVRLEVARGDLDAARAFLDGWPQDPGSGDSPARLLALAVVEHLEGDEAAAADHLGRAVQLAEVDGNLGLFRWHEAHRLARTRYREAPTPFLRAVVEQSVDTPPPTAVAELVEQLTDRERRVVQLLPTRLTNAEIATSLGISLNTVKTHLKHVYRKLEVEHRSDAIAAAERIGLL